MLRFSFMKAQLKIVVISTHNGKWSEQMVASITEIFETRDLQEVVEIQ